MTILCLVVLLLSVARVVADITSFYLDADLRCTGLDVVVLSPQDMDAAADAFAAAYLLGTVHGYGGTQDGKIKHATFSGIKRGALRLSVKAACTLCGNNVEIHNKVDRVESFIHTTEPWMGEALMEALLVSSSPVWNAVEDCQVTLTPASTDGEAQ